MPAPPQVGWVPLTRVTCPVRTISRMPYFWTNDRIASILSLRPVTSRVMVFSVRATSLTRNTLQISMISMRVVGVALTLMRASSRSTVLKFVTSLTLMTSISLLSCLMICSRTSGSPSTTMIMRETVGCSVTPTARLWMLYPLRRNSPATFIRTPGVLSTRTEMVCLMGRLEATGGAAGSVADAIILDDHLLDGLARRDHRVAVLLRIAEDVHHTGPVGHLQGAEECGTNFLRTAHRDPHGAKGLGQPGEIRIPEPHIGVPLPVEELLPLPHHPQRPVVDDVDLDRQTQLHGGGEVLHRHLKPAVAHDGDHQRIWPPHLGPQRRREPEPHRAQSSRGDPRARLCREVELGGPHLVLPDVRGDNGPALGDPVDLLDGELGLDHVRRLLVAEGVAPPPLGDLTVPRLAVRRDHLGRQDSQRLPRVPHYRDMRGLILADLGRADVDVDKARVWGEVLEPARVTVVEPHPHGQDDVGLVNGVVRVGRPVHPQHSQGQGIRLRERPLAHEGRGHGNSCLTGQSRQFR